MFALRMLRELDLSANKLMGQVPWKALSDMSLLETIDLSKNKLDGEVPWSQLLYRLSGLISFNISENRFSGMIPRSMWDQWPKSMAFIDLHNNSFHGELNLNAVNYINYMRRSTNRYIDISENKTFYISLSDMKDFSLLELRMTHCGLTAALPSQIPRLHNLIYMNISWNSLEGPLPDISALTQLKFFDASHNRFTGQLHFSLSRLKNLRNFACSSNQLSGSVPSDYFSKCFALRAANIAYNRLHINSFPRIFHLPYLDMSEFFYQDNCFATTELEKQYSVSALKMWKQKADRRWRKLSKLVVLKHCVLSAISSEKFHYYSFMQSLRAVLTKGLDLKGSHNVNIITSLLSQAGGGIGKYDNDSPLLGGLLNGAISSSQNSDSEISTPLLAAVTAVAAASPTAELNLGSSITRRDRDRDRDRENSRMMKSEEEERIKTIALVFENVKILKCIGCYINK